MISQPERLTPKDPAEIIPLTFDFASVTTAPISPVVTCTRLSGNPDASPSSLISGSATVSGSTVTQKITGGVAGTLYAVRCQVDTAAGERYVLVARLPVETAGA